VKNLFNQKMDSRTPTNNTNRLRIRFELYLERFVKRHNLSIIQHPDPIRVKRFNEKIAGAIEKQTEVLVKLEEVKAERIRLNLIITNVNAILEVKWLRKNRS
jgi:hypothetical protein